MTVPNNPKLSDVLAEFLAPIGTRLSAFLRGGAWVPETPVNANVPTALPIRLSQLAGASRDGGGTTPPGGFTVSISPPDSFQTGFKPGTRSDTFTCNTIGGVGPFTYLWSQTNTNRTFNFSDKNAQITLMSANALGRFGQVYEEGFVHCLVTDVGTGVQMTAEATFAWEWIGDDYEPPA